MAGKAACALMALMALDAAAQPDLRERFDQLHRYTRDDSAVPQANDQATFAWGVSYFMLAEVRMFQATGDTLYLDRALAKMSNVLDRRDDRRGVVDYRGRSLPAWRNVHYQFPAGRAYRLDDPENGRYAYIYAVHSGMIVYPMAALAELIRLRGAAGAFRGRTYSEWAGELITSVKETVAVHDAEWADHGADEGYYRFDDFPVYFANYANRNRDVPYNQSHTLGATLCVLYRITGESAYLEKAWRLANRFQRALSLNSEDAYVWLYWQRPDVYAVTGTGEDISHAALNVTFAKEAYDTGLAFDFEDMRRLGRTLQVMVLRQDRQDFTDACGGAWSIPNAGDYVTGGPRVNTYHYAVGRWLELTCYQPQVFAPVYQILDYFGKNALCARNPAVNVTVLLGQALAVLYQPLARE